MGSRGIVAGDVLWRLVARTITQQLGKAVEEATAPVQCALATRTSGECIAHALPALRGVDPESTCQLTESVLDVVGVGESGTGGRQQG